MAFVCKFFFLRLLFFSHCFRVSVCHHSISHSTSSTCNIYCMYFIVQWPRTSQLCAEWISIAFAAKRKLFSWKMHRDRSLCCFIVIIHFLFRFEISVFPLSGMKRWWNQISPDNNITSHIIVWFRFIFFSQIRSIETVCLYGCVC